MDICMYLLRPSSYLMVFELVREFRGVIGILGHVRLSPGFYVYVGSARKGALIRLRRYCSKSFAKPRWHIDYLLEFSKIDRFYIVFNAHESELAALLSGTLDVAIPRFGATDTRNTTHLFVYSEVLEELLRSRNYNYVRVTCDDILRCG